MLFVSALESLAADCMSDRGLKPEALCLQGWLTDGAVCSDGVNIIIHMANIQQTFFLSPAKENKLDANQQMTQWLQNVFFFF